MSSWACSKCTFINSPAQKSRCEICLSAPPQPLVSPPPRPESMWSCAACTLLNPYSSAMCQVCGTRATSTIEIDDDDLDEGASIGSVFMPLKACSNAKEETSRVGGSAELIADNGGRVDGGELGFSAGLRVCSNKRKVREEDGGGDAGGSSGFGAIRDSTMAIQAKPLAPGEAHLSSESKTWKLLSYNVWFREDLEMHKRMRAIGSLVELHSPDVMCFQEVTPNLYEIFQKSGWWKGYRCSIPDENSFPGPYFCMQLSKLPVKSYSTKPFHNSVMGRELCLAEVEVLPGTTMVVATSHLESPCPSPPTWNQMFSKERVVQANEAVRSLGKHENVIFCGDMNWDDKLDGAFPLAGGWVDAWTEMRPGEDGWTYDTKSNKMLAGNRSLQKRLDRFVCKLEGLKIRSIEMIGRDAIAGASYVKEKKVKGQVKELSLPVLPSDHYGLLLTISTT
ncbi:glucan endo-1,3-beta-D-glucosidase [Salvia divinorum]